MRKAESMGKGDGGGNRIIGKGPKGVLVNVIIKKIAEGNLGIIKERSTPFSLSLTWPPQFHTIRPIKENFPKNLFASKGKGGG
jgi:hypothetical protein